MGTPEPVPRLRGRETEQRLLGAVLDRVTSGSLAILLIEGEAGIGKTRLLKEGLAGPGATIVRRHWLMTEQAHPEWDASYTADTPARGTSAGRSRLLSGSLTRAA